MAETLYSDSFIGVMRLFTYSLALGPAENSLKEYF